MYKLVVLFALVAIVAAKPGHLHGAVAVAAPVLTKTYLAPAAVSSTYREDVITKLPVSYGAAPAIAYVAPIVGKASVSEPVAAITPVAVSYTAREDVISKPSAVVYAASPAVVATPVIQKTVAYAAPVAYATPAAISSSYRTDVVSSPAIAKTIVTPSVYSYGSGYAHGAHAAAVHAW